MYSVIEHESDLEPSALACGWSTLFKTVEEAKKAIQIERDKLDDEIVSPLVWTVYNGKLSCMEAKDETRDSKTWAIIEMQHSKEIQL